MNAFWLEDKKPLSTEELKKEGIDYEKIETTGYEERIDQIKKEKEYEEQDIVELNPTTPELAAIEAKFDKEHLHTDDEVRFVLAGEGIFDIRSLDDRWMRVEVYEGDYISVPKDRNHRFFLTDIKTIQCVRLFRDTAGWTPHYRSQKEPLPQHSSGL